VDVDVEPGEAGGDTPGRVLQLGRRNDAIEEAGRNSVFGAVDLRVDDGAVESARVPAVAGRSRHRKWGIVMPIATSLAPILCAPSAPTR
jgi:hypothetical protein